MPDPSTVDVFDPSGQFGSIPVVNWMQAKAAGYEMSQPVTAPDGTQGHVPSSKFGAARLAGYKARMDEPSTPSVFSGEYSGPTGTIAGGESLPHAVTRQAIGGVATVAKSAVAPPPMETTEDKLWSSLGPGGGLLRSHWETLKQAYQSAKQGDYTGAAGHGLLAAAPVIGPMIDNAITQAEKGTIGPAVELATQYGMAKGMPPAIEKVAPVVKKAFGKAAASTTGTAAAKEVAAAGDTFRSNIQKAIPPTRTHPYDATDLERAGPHLMDMHAAAPVTNTADFVSAADSAISRIEDHVTGIIREARPTLINKNVLGDVERGLANHPEEGFAKAAVYSLRKYNLDKPLTIEQSDIVRRQLNAENQAVLKRNNYDVATAEKVDPGFAARQLAVKSLRDGEYTALKEQGFPGVDDLRRTEGSVIKLRNAAQAKAFEGDRLVTGTEKGGALRQTGKALTAGAGAGVGGYVGGWPGAVAGGIVGERVGRLFTPEAMTRDALIRQAFPNIQMPLAEFPGRTTTPTLQLAAVPPPNPLGNVGPTSVIGPDNPTGFNRLNVRSPAEMQSFEAPGYDRPNAHDIIDKQMVEADAARAQAERRPLTKLEANRMEQYRTQQKAAAEKAAYREAERQRFLYLMGGPPTP